MRILFFVALSILSFHSIEAQTKSDNTELQKMILKIDACLSEDDKILDLAIKFEALSAATQNNWLTPYYSSYCYTMAAFLQQDVTKIDAILNKAEKLVDKATILKKNDSEISCIKSLIASARIIVDPNTRGQKYGMVASQAIQNAKLQNPENPRVYYLEAQSLMYMPEAYGGGCKNALPIMLLAKSKFENFQTDDTLDPNWGYSALMSLMRTCE